MITEIIAGIKIIFFDYGVGIIADYTVIRPLINRAMFE